MRRSALQLLGAAIVGTFPGRDDVRGVKVFPHGCHAEIPGCIRGPQAPCVVSRGLQRGKHEIPLCRVFSHCFSARSEKRCPRRDSSPEINRGMRRAEVVAPYGWRQGTDTGC